MGAPVLRDVLLFHEPGPRPVGLAEELEGDQGLQERRVLAAEAPGRKGCQSAPACPWCRDDRAEQGAGRLHWRQGPGALQGRHLQVLSWGQVPCSALVLAPLRRNVGPRTRPAWIP